MASGEEDWFTPTQPAIVPVTPVAPTSGPLSQRKPIVPLPAPPAVQKVEKDSKGGGEDPLNSPSSVFNKSNPANPASFLKPFAMSTPSEQQVGPSTRRITCGVAERMDIKPTLVRLVGSDRGSSPATEPIPDVANMALEFVNMTAADFAGTSPDRSKSDSETSRAPSPVQSLTDYLITQDVTEFLENELDNEVSSSSPPTPPAEWPALPASVTEVHSRPSSPLPDYGRLSPAPPRFMRPRRRYALARPGLSIANPHRNPVHPFSIRDPRVHRQEAVYNTLMSADPHHRPGPAGRRLACNFAYQGVPSGHLLDVFHTGERVENNYLWEVADMNPEFTEKEFVFQVLQQAFEEQYKMPRTYDEAVNDPDNGLLFLAAMNEEVKSWCQNRVFKIVERTPEMLDQLVSTRWLFTPKFNQDGNIIRMKARVVARGFSQQEGVNIRRKDIFTSTLSLDSLRIVLAITAHEALVIHQIDFSTAFLNAPLLEGEKVYLTGIPGYTDLENSMLELHKAVYGLGQSHARWGNLLRDTLTSIGWEPTQSDSCIYIRARPYADGHGFEWSYLCIYVDDILIIVRPTYIDSIKNELMGLFKAKDLGHTKHYMGLKIKQDLKTKQIKLSMPAYINALAERFELDLEHAPNRHESTPLPTNHGLCCGEKTTDKSAIGAWATACGSILWPTLTCHPEIAYAVSLLSSHTHYLTPLHWCAMSRIIVYLRDHAEEGIIFDGHREFVEYGMVDASWGSCQDTGKSQDGYVFFLAGGAVAWRSKLQSVVALSTMEVEYMAVTPAVKTAIWLRGFLNELEYVVDRSTTIFCNNNAALSLIKNPVERQRARHIHIQYHFTRNEVKSGTVRFKYVKSAENWADIMTKALPFPMHTVQTAMMWNRWSGYANDAADQNGSLKRK
ncbi:hypothetical protein FRC06_011583, partial [Ceratobasidium sp. 370]